MIVWEKKEYYLARRSKWKRIDKIIASQTNYSRKDVKKLISQKKVRVNDEIVKDLNKSLMNNRVQYI